MLCQTFIHCVLNIKCYINRPYTNSTDSLLWWNIVCQYPQASHLIKWPMTWNAKCLWTDFVYLSCIILQLVPKQRQQPDGPYSPHGDRQNFLSNHDGKICHLSTARHLLNLETVQTKTRKYYVQIGILSSKTLSWHSKVFHYKSFFHFPYLCNESSLYDI